MLEANSSIAKWLVEEGHPLHQYTLDVAPEFEDLDKTERAEWHRLRTELFLPVNGEITETDYFRDLRNKAQKLREKR